MSYITINNYFINLPKAGGNKIYPLVKSIPAQKTTPSEIYDIISQEDPIYAGTITIDAKKFLNKNYYEKIYMIEKALTEYGKNKATKYIGFMETTTGGQPHCHLLCTGFQAPFIRAFKHLGIWNKNDMSFQPVKNKEKYKEYIMKDHKPGYKYYYKL